MPTAGMLYTRSRAHRGEKRGKRAMQIPPTQVSSPGAFTRTTIHCKRDTSSLQHSHSVTVTHPNSLICQKIFTVRAT